MPLPERKFTTAPAQPTGIFVRVHYSRIPQLNQACEQFSRNKHLEQQALQPILERADTLKTEIKAAHATKTVTSASQRELAKLKHQITEHKAFVKAFERVADDLYREMCALKDTPEGRKVKALSEEELESKINGRAATNNASTTAIPAAGQRGKVAATKSEKVVIPSAGQKRKVSAMGESEVRPPVKKTKLTTASTPKTISLAAMPKATPKGLAVVVEKSAISTMATTTTTTKAATTTSTTTATTTKAHTTTTKAHNTTIATKAAATAAPTSPAALSSPQDTSPREATPTFPPARKDSAHSNLTSPPHLTNTREATPPSRSPSSASHSPSLCTAKEKLDYEIRKNRIHELGMRKKLDRQRKDKQELLEKLDALRKEMAKLSENIANDATTHAKLEVNYVRLLDERGRLSDGGESESEGDEIVVRTPGQMGFEEGEIAA